MVGRQHRGGGVFKGSREFCVSLLVFNLSWTGTPFLLWFWFLKRRQKNFGFMRRRAKPQRQNWIMVKGIRTIFRSSTAAKSYVGARKNQKLLTGPMPRSAGSPVTSRLPVPAVLLRSWRLELLWSLGYQQCTTPRPLLCGQSQQSPTVSRHREETSSFYSVILFE